MKTAHKDLLHQAAEVIRERGLHKGGYFESRGTDRRPLGGCCVLGAVLLADGRTRTPEIGRAWHGGEGELQDVLDALCERVIRTNDRLEQRYLDPDDPWETVTMWSDHDRTTAEEAAALLDAVAGEVGSTRKEVT